MQERWTYNPLQKVLTTRWLAKFLCYCKRSQTWAQVLGTLRSISALLITRIYPETGCEQVTVNRSCWFAASGTINAVAFKIRILHVFGQDGCSTAQRLLRRNVAPQNKNWCCFTYLYDKNSSQVTIMGRCLIHLSIYETTCYHWGNTASTVKRVPIHLR